MANDDPNELGKKVFFLYPPAFVQNQIMAELTQEEFEVYTIKDVTNFPQILKKYPGSVVFANINDGMKEKAWEEWIIGIMANPDTAGTAIGIISSDETKKFKYTEQIKVHCGYSVIKSDFDASLKQMISVLNSVNAKGRRKHLRVVTDKDTNTAVNISLSGRYAKGIIKDISVVGFSCFFIEEPKLTKNKLYDDIQIRLQTQLLKVEGIIFGSRMDGEDKNYVILFTQRIDPDVKTRIRKFIQSVLQSRINDELKEEAKSKDEKKSKDEAKSKDEPISKEEAKPKDDEKSKDKPISKEEAKPKDEAISKDEPKPGNEPK